MKNKTIQWNGILDTRKHFYGHIENAYNKAKEIGYKYIYFNERIYEVGEYNVLETELTIDDIQIKETVDFKGCSCQFLNYIANQEQCVQNEHIYTSRFQPKPKKTNFEILSESIEMLAKMFVRITECGTCFMNKECYKLNKSCQQAWIDYLNKPSEQ